METIGWRFKGWLTRIGVHCDPARADRRGAIASPASFGNVYGICKVTDSHVVQESDLNRVSHLATERWRRRWTALHFRKRVWPYLSGVRLIVAREVTHLSAVAHCLTCCRCSCQILLLFIDNPKHGLKCAGRRGVRAFRSDFHCGRKRRASFTGHSLRYCCPFFPREARQRRGQCETRCHHHAFLEKLSTTHV